jgi:hypothetical protein
VRRSLSVAFVLPHGEPDPGFFPDTLLELCCTAAREAGHRARMVRVYYDGRDPTRDAEIRRRLRAWLAEQGADVVVVERLFDPEPVAEHLAAGAGRAAIALCWGSWDPIECVEWVLGLATGTTADGRTRRSPAAGDLVQAFSGWLAAFAEGRDPLEVPGVARALPDRLEWRRPLERAALPSPFAPTLVSDMICHGEAPRLVRRHLFGNAGCPHAADPTENAYFRGLPLAADGTLSLLGCTFCHAGGDYQRRPDREVVESLIEQARWFQCQDPTLEELVIVDQHPVRYLELLMRAAVRAGLRPTRWLFQTRADSFLRERDRVVAALMAAGDGHQLETYLIGFETFSDRELARYGKGVTAAQLVDAVRELRALRARFPGRFEFARARGHSLILFGPWTTLDDLATNVAVIREHELDELFSELGRNRLRLYRDLPICKLAARDGALSENWDVEGAGRRKGYAQELPWRFLDPRTRDVYALCGALRELLGPETELGQLAASIELARAGEIDVERVAAHVAALAAALDHIARAPGRAPSVRATPVRVDRCPPRFDGPGPFLILGHASLDERAILTWVTEAARDGRTVALECDVRACSDPAFTERLLSAGLGAAVIRAARPDAAQRAGLDALRRVPLELRARLGREQLRAPEALAECAMALGIGRLRVEVAIDRLGLENAVTACEALERLALRCRQGGVALDARPLAAGPGYQPIPA